jgi:hypothetical protein
MCTLADFCEQFGTYKIPRFLAPRFIALAQILRFLRTEGLWQPCVEHASRRHFSNSMCSLRVSVSHFGNSRNISNFLIIIVSVIVTCD